MASIYYYIGQKYFIAEAEKQFPVPHLFLSNSSDLCDPGQKFAQAQGHFVDFPLAFKSIM